MILSIFVAVVFIAILIMFAAGLYASKTDSKGDDRMIKKIYIYLVLFATLMMSIGGGINIFMNLADMLSPQAYYQSFDDYKMTYDKVESEKPLSEDELLQRYNLMKESFQKSERARAMNGVIKSLGWIIIPLPIFIFYQRKLSKSDL